MAVRLLGCPTTLGIPHNARQHGPQALRQAGLAERIRATGVGLEDLGDLVIPAPGPHLIDTVAALARQQAEVLGRGRRPGDLLLTMGGDHSTSLGTLTALCRLGIDCDVIWIDAHADFNTPATSPSGNPHGMVLAMACGMMGHSPKVLDPARIRMMGVREVDPGERLLLHQEGVKHLTPSEVLLHLSQVIGGLAGNVYISFDVDAVDPSEAPATRTPVPHGFSRRDAIGLVRAIARHRRVVALDLVEYHPDLDVNSRTASLLLDVAAAAIPAPASIRGA